MDTKTNNTDYSKDSANFDKNFLQPKQKKSQEKSSIGKILDQRFKHRRFLFVFAIGTTLFSIVGIVTIICFQSYFKITRQIEILSSYEIVALSVGVFTQVIGVIIVIAKSLWDDTPYKDTF